MRTHHANSRRLIRLLGLIVLGWHTVGFDREPAFADEASSTGHSALFDRLDSNRDGKLMADEISAEHERLFARLVRRADDNDDSALSREEFFAGLVPSRPSKSLDAKQPGELPQANAVRYLLLSMDTDGNSAIVADEVPDDFRWAFEAMLERIDKNGNQSLERVELIRGGPQLARLATRYTLREGVDVLAELRRLERKLGPSANRFDSNPLLGDYLTNPQQARQLFRRLDRNEDGQLMPQELPGQLQGRLAPLFRRGDRDRDGQLSEREFATATERRADRLKRRGTNKETETAPRSEMDSNNQ